MAAKKLKAKDVKDTAENHKLLLSLITLRKAADEALNAIVEANWVDATEALMSIEEDANTIRELFK